MVDKVPPVEGWRWRYTNRETGNGYWLVARVSANGATVEVRVKRMRSGKNKGKVILRKHTAMPSGAHRDDILGVFDDEAQAMAAATLMEVVR